MTDSVYVTSGPPNPSDANPVAPTLADSITSSQTLAAQAATSASAAAASATAAAASATAASTSQSAITTMEATVVADLAIVQSGVSTIGNQISAVNNLVVTLTGNIGVAESAAATAGAAATSATNSASASSGSAATATTEAGVATTQAGDAATSASAAASSATSAATSASNAAATAAAIAAAGVLEGQGTWNASTNTPTLASGTGTKGYVYIVSTAGTTTLDGISQWYASDWAYFDGAVWRKIDGVTLEVTSVAGRTGAVTIASTDLTDSTSAGRTLLTAASAAAQKTALSIAVADVSGAAPLASAALTGTPTAPTAAADTNTTQLATTAMVLGQAASATPVMDGSVAVGVSTRYARADHVHASDTSRVTKAGDTMTGALNWAAAVSVASAATTDLGAQTGSNLVNITGTTNITSFGSTGAAGCWKWVKFGGALTLTYNATSLILPTDASITTAPGDTALFVSSGSGNWTCYTYQTASGVPLAGASGGDITDPEWFGDGSDGTVTISSGTTTLTRDMFYANLTISGTGSLNTAGFRVYVSGTLTLSNAPAGAIVYNGASGGNASGNTAGAAPAALAAGTICSTNVGKAGTASGVGTQPTAVNIIGGQAGASGASGAGGDAGAAANGVAVSQPRIATDSFLVGAVLPTGGAPGPGAGGPGGGAGGAGGAGGTGGGIIAIFARTIARGASTAAAAIQALGGNGGTGGASTGTGDAGGGGGAAGGGVIYIVFRFLTGAIASGILSAAGGVGGNGGAAATSGDAGYGGTGGYGGLIALINIAAATITTTTGSAGGSPVAPSGTTGGVGGTAGACTGGF